MCRSSAIVVPNRLAALVTTALCLMAAQLFAASCTSEPAPYAAQVTGR